MSEKAKALHMFILICLWLFVKCESVISHYNEHTSGPSKMPFVGYFKECSPKKKSFIDVKGEKVCLLCSTKNILKGTFKQITLLLTKIIWLTVNL